MPRFGRLLAGLQGVTTQLNSTRDAAQSCADGIRASSAQAIDATNGMSDQIRARTDEAREHVGTRVDDLLFDLERMSNEGNAWATSLLDIVHQVEAGTVDAGKAIGSMGDGVILFEGQLRSVKDVLLDVLPTTGQVQQSIRELREELEGADVSELVERLRGQWNQVAQTLAETAHAFSEGRASIERVLQVAQQAQQLLPGSETAATAAALIEAIRNEMLGGG